MQQQIIESIPSPVAFPDDLAKHGQHRMFTMVQVQQADAIRTQSLPEQPARDLTGAEVFFVLSSGFSIGQRRPAVVVRDWGNYLVNLQVFVDGLNDFAPGDVGSDGLAWATSVQYAPGAIRTPGTWHWRTESF